ncbi:MAG: UPF0147 family protein [Candidatus Micrarchaeia archaeon]|jgi:uncharacterized protein (UPF0147 family)
MRKSKKVEEKINEIINFIATVTKDTSIPKNVRAALEKAKVSLENVQEDQTVRISNAVYTIQEVSNDVNLPLHARTQIWQILGMLEKVKK